MKQYNITAKIWVKTSAQTEEEAQTIAKHTIDQALYEYVDNQTIPNTIAHLSKAKVTWVKEADPNMGKRKNNTSGHRGIYWDKRGKKWVVQVTVHGKRKTLGRFAEKDEAVKAYQDHAKSVFGDYII